MKHLYAVVTLGATAAFGVVYQVSQPAAALRCDVDPADFFAHRDGKREARAALAEGRLISVTFGQPVEWDPEFKQLLREEYGIEVRTIAGCLVTDGMLRYAREFNAVMEPAILERHGPRIFDEADTRAQQRFAERRQKETVAAARR